jgi:DNA-binding IclR family transcriptional regulator
MSRRPGRPPGPVAAPTVRAVRTACKLLRAFSLERSALSLTDLADATRLHKSTCLRLAASLIAEGLLIRDSEGRFRVGPLAHVLGSLYREAECLPCVVQPELARLAEVSRESASLFIRDGNERLLLLRVPSPESVRDHLEIGARLPLDKGAPGKILCAFGEPPPDLTQQMLQELNEVRRNGFAVSLGERDPQLFSLAAPLMKTRGVLVGSLSLSGPRIRLTPDRLPGMVKLLTDSARDLSAILGYQGEPIS